MLLSHRQYIYPNSSIAVTEPKEHTMNNIKSSALNPSASEFSPSHDHHPVPRVHLPSITEEASITYTRAKWWDEQALHPSDDVLKNKNLVYISKEITSRSQKHKTIDEYFQDPQSLAYYLRFQCRKQVIDGDYKVFISRVNGQQLALFNTELHSAQTRYILYIIAYANNYRGKSTIKWQMDRFMTAPEIYASFRINCGDLPAGSRWKLRQNGRRMMLDVMFDLHQLKKRLYAPQMHNTLMHLEQIKSKMAKYPRYFTVCRMAEHIQHAIDTKVLMPVLWFHKRKAEYHIQMLLPINVANGDLIGITFEYKDNYLQMDKLCIDDVDVRRKCALFKPSKDKNEYLFFQNNIKEIYIRG